MKKLLLLAVPMLLCILAFRPTNSLIVSGKVTDSSGMPVAGATISVKGNPAATASDAKGEFKIEVPNKHSTLVIAAVGYSMQEIILKGKTVLTVVLAPSGVTLNEVVHQGYGIQRKMNATGSPMKVQGRVPGIMIRDQDIPDGYGYGGADMDSVFNTEGYDHITENRFLRVTDNPLSTFSIDVDAASYSNIRRFLNQGQMPPAGAVRIEEMVNYFHYEYPQPQKDQPFSINTEISDCPWNKNNKLVLIGLQGKKIPTENLPSSNIVFLIDVSGSMSDAMKLPLVKASMKMLVDQLRENDKVAMVVYAGAAGVVLPATSGEEKTKIKDAIDRLEAGGSTAGGAGIKLAYKIAGENFVKGGNNRVILCTDGDFNVGASSDDDMERLIESERKSGVFLTVLGYGMGNYKDSKMQKLADKGNGNHAYIDGMSEAKKVLVNEFGGTLFTIAKDVKLQIEFNPSNVQGYRLIGYENRMLNKEDFNNDKKDAGELGSGHTVTALYEIIPVGVKTSFLENVDKLKYQEKEVALKPNSNSNEIMTVKFRYKAPDEDVSKLIEHTVLDLQMPIGKTSDNFRFAAAVSEFGMLLRNSEFKSHASFSNVLNMAQKAKGNDEEGYRTEFIRLVQNAVSLTRSIPRDVIGKVDNDEDDTK